MIPAKQTSLEISEVKNTEISFFNNCRGKKSERIKLEQLFQLIKTGDGFKNIIEKIRVANTQNEIDELKKELPAVTISGVYGESRKKENLISYSRLIQIDLDKVKDISTVRGQLEKDKYAYALFLSPSGKGLKIIIPVLSDLNSHGNTFLFLEKYFLKKYGLQIDKSCKDVTRLMFLSWDEKLFFNEKADFFSENKFQEDLFISVLNKLNRNEKFEPGNRNKFVFRLASLCSQEGISFSFTEKEIIKTFSASDFQEKEIIASVKSAFSNPVNTEKDKKELTNGNEKKENKKNFSHIARVESYINSKYELRQNEVSLNVEYRKQNSNDAFEVLNENNLLRELLLQSISISAAKLTSLLASDFVQPYNPFKNYFDGLGVWNEKENPDYIEKLCSFLPVKDGERFRKQFKKMLVRCIACALEDNVFNKQAFILIHPEQNSGKSTFSRWLCPPALKEYISENIRMDKDGLIALTENFLINLDELAVLSKAEINQLKSVFSMDKVKVRAPYERKAVAKPRRANFIGSTNKDEFLSDETGTVRFLCFELTDKINFAYKTEVSIDDVWRQAYALYKSGFAYQLTLEEIAENEAANRQYQIISPEMQLVQRKYKPALKTDQDAEFLTASDILKDISADNIFARLNTQAIGKAMKLLGFAKDSKYNESTGYTIKGYYLKRFSV